jgi:uroporphyrinogen III methyltransferase/synthase
LSKHTPPVALVGAGPGDPGLITLRGADLLALADVVVYDYLANPRLLKHCPNAQVIYVGKKAADHTMTQEDINNLLVDLARQGKRVVRLKGGDPFVFGRGGEECQALAAAGIPFEVVPGITAAIGAPAYAGIPVTHRDLNSSFTFITGHEKEEQYQEDAARARGAAHTGSSDVDWAVIAKLPCIAFYMGVKSLPRICANLIANGMDPQTPAATIRWGTRPNQRTVVSTVKDLPDAIVRAKLGPPALTIIGRVVPLRETINWFETRPLYGQTILVTRTRQQSSDLSEQLEALGAQVIEAPTIEIAPPADLSAVDQAIRGASRYDWIVFTSVNGVAATRRRLDELGLDVRVFGQAKIAAIGQATGRAVREQLCLNVDLCPQRSVAESLSDALHEAGEIAGKRYLLLRADIARPVLRERLSQHQAAEVTDIAIYETRPADSLPDEVLEALENRQITWITFTSSSTAKNLHTLLGDRAGELLSHPRIATIGPVTTETVKGLGLQIAVEARESTIDALVDAIRASGA